MNILGLKCLLNNIYDENPELRNKGIQKLETKKRYGKYYLIISFRDGEEMEYKLFETEGDEDG